MATAFFNTPEKSVVNLFHDPPGLPAQRVLPRIRAEWGRVCARWLIRSLLACGIRQGRPARPRKAQWDLAKCCVGQQGVRGCAAGDQLRAQEGRCEPGCTQKPAAAAPRLRLAKSLLGELGAEAPSSMAEGLQSWGSWWTKARLSVCPQAGTSEWRGSRSEPCFFSGVCPGNTPGCFLT